MIWTVESEEDESNDEEQGVYVDTDNSQAQLKPGKVANRKAIRVEETRQRKGQRARKPDS